MLVTVDASAVPPNAGGVGRYVAGLLGALDRREDVSVVVLAGAGDIGRWREAAPGSSVRDVAPRSVPVRLAWEQAALPRLLRRISPAAHHGTHYTFPRRSKIPNVVTIHDLTFVEHPEWHSRAKALFFADAIKIAARQADAVVCVSSTTADKLTSLYTPTGTVVVAPHGVDTHRFRPEQDSGGSDAEALRLLDVPVPYVLYVGTVEPRKDVPTLVRAFDRLSDRHPTLSLVIAGGGWPRAEATLRDAVSRSRHPGRVKRLGFVPDGDVPPLLRQAAAVVYPSLEEGFGLPALEALACGAATITTRGSAMEEFAAGAALMFDPGDDASLADLIHQLVIGDPTLDSRRSAGLSIAGSYTWDASAELHMEAYRRAAG
ncbi:MAG TPA: glycosyltransferase family 1 protein [Acidimicrobiales bacterium]|nr:glycosyltransferase family 1 protein [Acidimicrobiales bacterium]